jgi:hypothetical protein
VGPIPQGADICHHCDTPSCINPAHLFPGSARDNALDMGRKGRAGMTRYPERSYLGRPDCILKGERASRAKLTDDQVRQIRALRQSGRTHPSIAREFSISTSYVQKLVDGRAPRVAAMIDAIRGEKA